MILKVKNTKGGWKLFEDVKEVDYYQVLMEGNKTTKRESKEVFLPIPDKKEVTVISGGYTYYYVVAFNQDASSIKVRADRSIYLLNNEGKTIERIN